MLDKHFICFKSGSKKNNTWTSGNLFPTIAKGQNGPKMKNTAGERLCRTGGKQPSLCQTALIKDKTSTRAKSEKKIKTKFSKNTATTCIYSCTAALSRCNS